MDANIKLGPKYIKNYSKPISTNGRILSGIIERHALTVANGIEGKTSGVITRKRSTKTNNEESAIDFVLLSSDMVNCFVSLHVDEERDHVLTSITNTKKRVIKQESDHNTIITKFDIKYSKDVDKQRIEIFNFIDSEGQKKFKELTDSNTLSSIFDNSDRIEKQAKKFMKQLNRILHQSFKKIRIKPEAETKIEKMFKKQKELKQKTDKQSKEKLKKLEEEMAKNMSEDMYNIIRDEVSEVNSDEGGFNSGLLWRLKNKLRPKKISPPTAMIDKNGKLITDSDEIKKAALDHYKTC